MTLHSINQSLLKSNDKSRSIDQERLINTNSIYVLFFQLGKEYGPQDYGESNNILSSAQNLPLYPVNNVNQNLMSNENLECQHCNKLYKTEST